ncbi:hlyD secretion family protein, partial [Vibrio parahaemolyticus V-223/04]
SKRRNLIWQIPRYSHQVMVS